MTTSKRYRIRVLADAIGLIAVELGGWLSIPDVYGFVSTAQTIVRRRLMPAMMTGSHGVRRDAALRYS